MNEAEQKFVHDLLYEILELKKTAVVDELTGIYNFRHLTTQLPRCYNLAKRKNIPLSIMMLDIDNFSLVNNNYGHEMGNIVLKDFAEIIRNSIRSVDILYRYGGEEFTIVLQDTNKKFTKILAERIRERIEKAIFGTTLSPIKITCSIGSYTIYIPKII